MKMPCGLSLAALDSTDVSKCRKWRNRYEIWKWCRQSDFISDIEQSNWFDRQSKDPSIKMYKILTHADDLNSFVGVCGLTSIDWVNRRAEFSLYIDPDKHKRGYGREALKLLLMHAFTNLNLNLVWGESFVGNPAIKMFVQLGFKPEGTRRQFYFKDGKYIDAYLVSLTAKEWREHGKPSAGSESVSNPKSGGVDRDAGDVLDISPIERKSQAPAKPRLKTVEKQGKEKASSDQR